MPALRLRVFESIVAVTMEVVGAVGLDIARGWLGLGQEVMREKRATTFVVARFCNIPAGPPTSWVPLRVSCPSILPSSES
jgi:hypothetical protein